MKTYRENIDTGKIICADCYSTWITNTDYEKIKKDTWDDLYCDVCGQQIEDGEDEE